MKISDLSNKEQTNEGFRDFIDRTGLTGQSNKQSALQKQQNERAKAIGLKDFTYKLNSALQSAIKSGVVTTSSTSPAQSGTSPVTSTGQDVMNSPAGQQLAQQRQSKQQDAQSQIDKTSVKSSQSEPSMAELLKKRQQHGLTESKYKLFDELFESKILTEQGETISKFITDFIDNQTKNLSDNPNYQRNVEMIAKKLEDQYTKTKKLDPNLVEQAWETIWAWSQLGPKRGQSNRQQSVDMDNDGVDDTDQREQLKRNMIKIIRNVDFNDPVKLKSIEPSIEGLLKMIQAIK